MVKIYRIVDGQAEPLELPVQTLAEASLALPAGVYTTLRVYPGGRAVRLDDHLARLETSGQLLGRPLGLDRAEVRSVLGAALRLAGLAEARVRLTAIPPAGAGPAEVIITLEPFTPPGEEIYTRGVHVQIVPALRTQPRAKTTDFIAPSRKLYREMPPGIYELLMVDGTGHILEGLTSNFFALKDDRLYTAGSSVLEGVTRGMVVELAARTLPVQLEPVWRGEVTGLEEAFITSSSREIVPVVAIDAMTVGTGLPGPVTRHLLDAYRAQVRKEWQTLT